MIEAPAWVDALLLLGGLALIVAVLTHDGRPHFRKGRLQGAVWLAYTLAFITAAGFLVDDWGDVAAAGVIFLLTVSWWKVSDWLDERASRMID